MTTLFDPIQHGALSFKNRIAMAPMTRGRANPDGVPNDTMAEYYRLRADAGLIIVEATAISQQAYGWVNAPGIWNDEQVAGWQKVTKAVHDAGGVIFIQLWHMGRVTHPDFFGLPPFAPSAIAVNSKTYTPNGLQPYVTPHEMTVQDIQTTLQDYKAAAERAMAAGFDGVELHSANGYLLDEFIRDGSNKRTDEYGGSIDNRLRFTREATQILCDTIGADKVGVRLSPMNPYNDMTDSNPEATFTAAAAMLNEFNLAYLHVMEAQDGQRANPTQRITPHMRKAYQGTFIANGSFDKARGMAALANNEADIIAYGTPYLANPDLVERYRTDAPLNKPDMKTFYSGGPEHGYLDYPLLSAK